MEIHKINDVYTPTQPARKNFIKRQSLDKRVKRAIVTPGMQVILYGHSGSGKTTLLLNKLRELNLDFVKTNCTSNLTFDNLLSNVYLSLNKKIETKETIKDGVEGGGALGAPAVFGFSSKNTTGTSTEKNYISIYESTELSLAKIIGEDKGIWIIEDFHKLKREVKLQLSQLMKVFMDLSDDYPRLKIIALGAKNTAREVVELDVEMQTRVSEIHVPLMTDNEIEKIIVNGANLLNIVARDNVIRDVVDHSHGVASICHQLCLLMCEEADVEKTEDDESSIELDYDHFNFAAAEYIQQVSDTLKSAFQKSIKVKNSYEVLDCLIQCDIDGMEISEILDFINDNHDNVEFIVDDLKETLVKMSDIENGSVLLFDETTELYSFKDPFYKMFTKLYLKEKAIKKKRTPVEYHKLFTQLIISAKKQYSNPTESGTTGSGDYFPHSDEDDTSRINNKWKKTKPKINR
ncbi:MAG: Cdc6-like AAA superfamily ATPase [Cocleimonas sp.]|jgi:Cdc6-like AAA superfamily ATPase